MRMVSSPCATSAAAGPHRRAPPRDAGPSRPACRAIRKSAADVNRPSLSCHGADTSGMPQASASKTRIVGMPGSIST